MKHVEITTEGPISVVWWNHEDQNRFTTPFVKELLESVELLKNDRSVRGIVLTGKQEKYFSTGLHLEWMMGQAQKDVGLIEEFLFLLSDLLVQVTGFPKPTVCAVNGHAVAAGCVAVGCCDYRLMNRDRGFVGLPEVKVNVPFWPGMTALFQDILPPQSFRDMSFTGDNYTPQQALEMGFIDQLHPGDELLSKAIELAQKLATSENKIYGTIKRELRSRVLDKMKNEDPVAIRNLVAMMKKAVGQ